MQRLIEGIHKFRNEEFGHYEELFQRLARDGQNPHTLFITCSDSRVLAELITQSKPGDLFVVKNVGNIVPPHDSATSAISTGAAIEFAVGALGVEDIVVCGHSQCGAMRALIEAPDLSTTPHLAEWLTLARPVRDTVLQRYQHLEVPEHRYNAAAEENVLFALENLKTFPCVQRRLEEGSLRLHGWYFKIATAELHAYDPNTKQFVPFGEEWQPDLQARHDARRDRHLSHQIPRRHPAKVGSNHRGWRAGGRPSIRALRCGRQGRERQAHLAHSSASRRIFRWPRRGDTERGRSKCGADFRVG